MAKSGNFANHTTLKLIPFITPAEESLKSPTKSQSLLDTGLSGKEVSQFYNSVISTTPTQAIVKSAPRKNLKKLPPPAPSLNLSHDSIFRFAQEGNVNMIKQCVKAGYSIDLQDVYGWTPLMCATCEGHSEVVEYLLKQGADTSIKCKQGMTPLDIAIKTNNTLIKELLQSGPKLDMTPICSAIQPIKKFCSSCKVNYNVPTATHEGSIAHLFNTKKTELSTFYHIPENNKGFQIMLKSGWDKNKGLGIHAEGRKFPIKTVLKKDRACIGKSKERAKVTHFNANDRTAIKAAKQVQVKAVREKTLKKWQRKKLDEMTRQREIDFRRQFNSDF